MKAELRGIGLGWGARIRTWTAGSKDRSATLTPLPNTTTKDEANETSGECQTLRRREVSRGRSGGIPAWRRLATGGASRLYRRILNGPLRPSRGEHAPVPSGTR